MLTFRAFSALRKPLHPNASPRDHTFCRGALIVHRFFAITVLALFLLSFGTQTRAQSHLWSQRFGDTDRDAIEGVAVDAAANIIIVGHFAGNVDFGGGALTSAGLYDIILASYDENGTHNWSQRFGDTVNDEGFAVAVDSEANIAITGYFRGSVDFGGGAVVSDESEDIFVAKFDIAGNYLWSFGYQGGSNSDEGQDIAFDPDGNVLVTDDFGDTVNFGGGPLTAGGFNDIFLLKFDADGNHVWSYAFGDSVDTQHEAGRGVAAVWPRMVTVTSRLSASSTRRLTSAAGRW